MHAKKCMRDKTQKDATNRDQRDRLDKIDQLEKNALVAKRATKEGKDDAKKEDELWSELEVALREEVIREEAVRCLMTRARKLHSKKPKDECQKVVTATRKKENNPVWDETLLLTLPPWSSTAEGREGLFDHFEFASCSLMMRC
eukprot:COSAG01_NODE_2826_length_7003_cov_149.498117_3_plen_143_part_01